MKNLSGRLTLESMSLAGWYNSWLLSKFEKDLRGNILEVGCGIGNFTQSLAKYGRVIAIDTDKSYISKSKQKVGNQTDLGFGNIENGEYFFGDEKFETVVCINVLEHIQNDVRAISNLHKLLKSEGRLILLVPSHQWLYGKIDQSISHFRRYNKAGLEKTLKEKGFKIVSSKRLNALGAVGWAVVGKILKDKIIAKGKIKVFNSIAPVYLKMENFFEPPIGLSILIIAKKS